MNPISILMFIFAAMLLIVALLIYKGNTGLIRTFNFVKVKDSREYARFLGKSLAMLALAPILGGVAGVLISNAAAGIVLVVLFIVEMVIIAKRSKNYYG